MKYSDALKTSMNLLAQDKRTLFIGYNVVNGSRAYGTFSDIPEDRCIETPVAENLMAGLGMGLSLEGYRPVVFFERHDFMLNALDALVNHWDKIGALSHGQFEMPMIVRAVVGGTKPIYPGLQHVQDFGDVFKRIFTSIRVVDLKDSRSVLDGYQAVLKDTRPALFIEYKNLYNTDC